MKQGGGSEDAKRNAGERAAAEVEDGMVVGLGTGSTAAHAIRVLGREVDAGLDVTGIPTSFQSRRLAREVGIPLTDLDAATPDVAIDGADQVAYGAGDRGDCGDDGEGDGPAGGGNGADGGDGPWGAALVKGGGAAHAREKYVDAAADRLLVVVDPGKEAAALDHPVPVEVLPDARRVVADRVRELGGEPALRAAERKDGPVVTDNGNLVLDCEFGAIGVPADLAAALSAVPGVVEHGLFVGLADAVVTGNEDGATVTET